MRTMQDPKRCSACQGVGSVGHNPYALLAPSTPCTRCGGSGVEPCACCGVFVADRFEENENRCDGCSFALTIAKALPHDTMRAMPAFRDTIPCPPPPGCKELS